jgi:HD-like signal output (HDOD) protein
VGSGRALLGTTHAEVGAYLLGLWGLPDAIVEALAFHHCPSACPDQRFSPLTAVHIANALVHTEDSPGGGTPRAR